ncbi:MAG: His-Xaa-Ser system radical SAM maturase HxsB [Myxococcota bacterium]
MSKFLPISHYQAPLTDGYKLLPFRFTRLAGDDYVLTNEAGEPLVLDRASLHAFVHHELDSGSPAYCDLKAKHFLLDSDSSLPIDLLALKVRTKLQRLADFTGLHIFVVSLRCEHSCPYCQVSRQSDDRVAYDMTTETADRALAMVFRSPSPAIKIEFQGGEPLLNFKLVRYIVGRADSMNQSHRKDLQFVVATNLALLTDEVLDFCELHGILLSTSLDGPRDLHNRNRPRPGGDSYERAVSGIARVRERLGLDRVAALMTTTEASLSRVREIVDEYVRLGFHGLFLRPLSPYGFAVKTKWYDSYGADRWLKFYFEGLDYIIELNKAGYPLVEQYAATVLSKMLTPFGSGYVDLRSPAGLGIAAIVYNYDGDVYGSDESRMLAEMNDKRFRLGNVHNDTYEQVFQSENLLGPLEESFAGSAPMCSECAFEPWCGAEPVYHYATQGDVVGNKPRSAFCSRNMAIFRRLTTLNRSDPETRRIFQRWANL